MTPRDKRDTRSFQPPPPDRKKDVWGWTQEIIQDGESWVQGQPCYKDLSNGIDLIAGKTEPEAQETRSRLTTNRAKRSLKEIIATIADTRYLDGFSSDNKAYQQTAEMLNKIVKAVYFESHFKRSIKQVCQWMAAGGSAYIWPVYRTVRLAPNSPKSICFDAFSCTDVLPFMLPHDNNNQNAYANTIVKMLAVPEAHFKFPKFQSQLKAIAKRRYRSTVVNTRMSILERWRMGGDRNVSPTQQYCEVSWTKVRDMTINETRKPIPMGDPGASWSYIVPFVGMKIPKVVDGVRQMVKAQEDDCYLYPNMRLIISGSGVTEPMYDGPDFDWHGMMPARFEADAWPWESLGYSITRDIYDVERTRQFTERAIDQVSRHRLDPSIVYDQNQMNSATAEQFDPWEARKRLGVDGVPAEQVFRPALPDWMLNVQSWVMEWLKHLETEEDYLLAVNQMSNLAKAQANIAGDGVEKMLEMTGPLTKDMSSSMETPVAEVMEMVKYDIFQYFDTARAMKYVGPDGIAAETFDFDPERLVPSHMPGEDTSGPSAYTSRMQRAKIFCENLRLSITPGSLHAVPQTEQKLFYLQLWRGGFPIAPDTVARALDLPNFGTIDGSTEIERFFNYKKMELEFAAKLRELGSTLGPPQPPGGAPGGAEAAGLNKPKPGRPPGTGAHPKPPTAEVKGSAEGPRAVISES